MRINAMMFLIQFFLGWCWTSSSFFRFIGTNGTWQIKSESFEDLKVPDVMAMITFIAIEADEDRK